MDAELRADDATGHFRDGYAFLAGTYGNQASVFYRLYIPYARTEWSPVVPGKTQRVVLEVVKPQRPDECCGFGGSFSVRYPGIWEASQGVSDAADQASAELGETTIAAIVRATTDFLVAFHRRPPLQ